MIFVTVGTGKFDNLVKSVDEMASLSQEKIVIQIGVGQYIPQNCKYFRFRPSLDSFYDEADIIIAHGGLGTTMEILKKGKKLISVVNPTYIDDQSEILEVMADRGHLLWCREINELPHFLQMASTTEMKPYINVECKIPEVIRSFINELK